MSEAVGAGYGDLVRCASCLEPLDPRHPLAAPCPSCARPVALAERFVLQERLGACAFDGIDVVAGRRVLVARVPDPGALAGVRHPALAEVVAVVGDWAIQARVEAPVLRDPTPEDVALVLGALDALHAAGLCHGHLGAHHLRAGPVLCGLPRRGDAARDLRAVARLWATHPSPAVRRAVGALEEGDGASDAMVALAAPRWAEPPRVDEPDPFHEPLVAVEPAPRPVWRRWRWAGLAAATVALLVGALIAHEPRGPDYTTRADVPPGYEAIASRYAADAGIQGCLAWHQAAGVDRRQVPALLTIERSADWRHGRYRVQATDPTLARCILARVRPIQVPEGRYRVAIPLASR